MSFWTTGEGIAQEVMPSCQQCLGDVLYLGKNSMVEAVFNHRVSPQIPQHHLDNAGMMMSLHVLCWRWGLSLTLFPAKSPCWIANQWLSAQDLVGEGPHFQCFDYLPELWGAYFYHSLSWRKMLNKYLGSVFPWDHSWYIVWPIYTVWWH